MAHEITINNGVAEMAYVGAKPWHGLGQVLQPGASIETWQDAAGLNWEILRSKVHYKDDGMQELHSHDVLIRSDTKLPLSVVSHKYREVQPRNVLEFFRDLISDDGFELETAGTLMGGRRIWALAKTGLGGEVAPGDVVNSYLLLVTSYDNALATTAQYTSVRVVCNNTLHMSLNQQVATSVRVRHNTSFNPEHVKGELGVGARHHYDAFMARMRSMSEQAISVSQAESVISGLMGGDIARLRDVRTTRGFKTMMQLFNGCGKGASLEGVAGTKWGLINAVTEYVDFHTRAKSQDNRLNSSWFGNGAKLKQKAIHLVEAL